MFVPVTEITRRIAARYLARRAQQLNAEGDYVSGDALTQEALRLERPDEHTRDTWRREYAIERQGRQQLPRPTGLN